MANKKILVIEDHSDLRRLITIYLDRAGYDVLEAETGLAAIERANVTRPDLITMDLGLPDMTGAEAITRIKADPFTKHIPVIVMTAYYTGSPLVESALAAGACEILHKPVALRILEETVERLLAITPNEASGRQTI